MHVLVVEDEYRTAAVVRELLEDMGFTSIDIAETEDEAVGSALARRPNLIISDVNLREGLGPVAVRRIRAAVGPVRTFYLTASPHIAREHDALATILPKPIMRQKLVATILSHARPDVPPALVNVA